VSVPQVYSNLDYFRSKTVQPWLAPGCISVSFKLSQFLKEYYSEAGPKLDVGLNFPWMNYRSGPVYETRV
jgi:hypothetical protein